MSRAVGEAGEYLAKPRRVVKERTRWPRKKPIRRSNPERRAKAFARNFDEEHRRFIGGLPCAIRRDRRFRIDCAHTERRKMGGVGGEWQTIVPLSVPLHRLYDSDQRRFERIFELRPLATALVVADPSVTPAVQRAAWMKLALFPQPLRGRALSLAMDLCGYKVEPPNTASDVETLSSLMGSE